MRRMTSTRRGGFTLVELLVVIAILAVLATLATAAFFRVRGSSTVSSTEATLQKLKSGLDKRWKAVLDDAADDVSKDRLPANIRDGLYRFAANDKDRVRVLWTYIKLKNEFPTTLAEACSPVWVPTLNADGSAGPYLPALQPKAVFVEGYRKQAGVAPGPTVTGFANALPLGTPAEQQKFIDASAVESAACFHWSLTATASRGETFGNDGTSQQTGEVDVQLPIRFPGRSGAGTGMMPALQTFKDAWGNPIAFVRQAFIPGETDKVPYTKAPVGKQDPIDPLGKLTTNDPAGWSNGRLDEFWIVLNSGVDASGNPDLTAGRHWCYDNDPGNPLTPVFPLPASGRGGVPKPQYQKPVNGIYIAQNWVPTLISAGSNKSFELGKGRFAAGDDLFSFRLGRDSKGN